MEYTKEKEEDSQDVGECLIYTLSEFQKERRGKHLRMFWNS